MEPKSDKHCGRKTKGPLVADRNPASSRLREARDAIQERAYPVALEILDAEAAASTSPSHLSKTISLAGDASARQGKLQEAIETYAAAESTAASHPRAWFRPVLAQVKTKLRHGIVGEASDLARAAVSRALKEERDFRQLLKKAEKEVEKTGQFVVVPRPPRASVVSTRLGHLFLCEGEPEEARYFFEKVVQVNPKGGCRARLGLAQIALSARDYEDAQRWALDGISNGKFQAKTLSGWKILVAARRSLGEAGLPPVQRTWLRENGSHRIGQRALQMVIEELRKSRDPLWRQLADEWLATSAANSFPIFQAHLRKLILAEMRPTGRDDGGLSNAATALWNTPQLSLREMISAARVIVDGQIAGNTPTNFTTFVSRASTEFGKEGGDRMRQTLAEVMHIHGRSPEALGLLQEIIASTPAGAKRWGRAMWRQAKIHRDLQNHGEAAEAYLSVAEQNKTPERIRNFALVESLRYATVAARPDILDRAQPLLEQALPRISDPELLLDMARQLGSAPRTHSLRDACRARGEAAIRAVIEGAQNPAEAVIALFKYARRQNDWGDFAGTVAYWESLPAGRKTWLWTAREEYWEYLAYVIRAYMWTGKQAQAEAMAAQIVDDPATPADGVAVVGNSYAATLLHTRRYSDALEIFQQVTAVAPRHTYAAFGHYWHALSELKAGRRDLALLSAAEIPRCLNERSQVEWIKRLLAQSEVLALMARDAADSMIMQILIQRMPEDRAEKLLKSIREDLAALP